MKKQQVTVGFNKGGGDQKSPTLDEAGIDKNLAKRARTAASVTEEKFEKSIAELRTKVTDGGEHGGRSKKDGVRETPSNPRPYLGGVSNTPPKSDNRPTLEQAGIDKSEQARRARARAPDAKTEGDVWLEHWSQGCGVCKTPHS